MAAYHHLMVHFPIALWTTAVLVILWRAFSEGDLAKSAARVLMPLLGLSIVTGVIAYLNGLMVFPYETIIASPLGRNHLLVASWTLAYWILLFITIWRWGEQVWVGINRWVMVLLALLGSGLLTAAGALGGHVSGSPSAVSQLFRLAGWNVYTTFYVPDFVLVFLVIAAAACVLLGWLGLRRRAE